MELLIALFFGIVQGATEFLPISGGGHLAMIFNVNQTIFGEAVFTPTLTFDVLLRLGTLGAIVFVFYADICQLWNAFLSVFRDLFQKKLHINNDDPYRKLLLMLVVTTLFLIPAYFLTSYTETYLTGLNVIAITLIITGISNVLIDKVGVRKSTNAFLEQHYEQVPELLKEQSEDFSVSDEPDTQTIVLTSHKGAAQWKPLWKRLKKAALIGLFQMCSVIPGLSRNSVTVLGSLVVGFKRDFAVKYTFLAAIPVLVTKIILQTVTVLQDGIRMNWLAYLIGMTAAFVTGVFAIGLMRKSVRKYYCKRFGWYCFVLGLIVFLIQMRG